MRLLTIFILAGKLCKPITLLYTSMGFTAIAAGVLAIGGETIVHLFYLGKQKTPIISTYLLDVLWGQPIKLIQVVSTSEFHEY